MIKELLEEIWEDTCHHSSLEFTKKHKRFPELVKAGKSKEGLFEIFSYLDTKHFWTTLLAIHQITEQNPIKPEHRGNVPLMKEDWIEWGKQNL